jgi:hypothetical protein
MGNRVLQQMMTTEVPPIEIPVPAKKGAPE